MLEWIKSLVRKERNQANAEADAEAPKPKGAVMSGKYLGLHKYLANRYADTVVLTFANIEDLLGFALPHPARAGPAWWTNTDPGSELSGHTDAWRLAHRSARPNLLAETVTFERES